MEHSLLFQCLVYLLAAVICVPIAKKLGLGAVLGYLIAGVVIGPSVTGIMGENSSEVMHFAEYGVVMMLFLIGMELEPELLWKLRIPIIGLGGVQVLLTTAAFTGAAYLLGLPLKASFAIGMILSLSSTAIVLQILKEKGWMELSAGQSSFSVLLFQDIAVIPMLAVFPLLASSDVHTESESHTLISGQPGWVQTLVVLGAVIAIIFAGRYLVRPLLSVVARTRVRELFTASALLLVIAIIVLMTLVGMSPALGSFLGGVVLANSEYRHELESDIEPFKGLLLGLFFMAVGASIDFKLIWAEPLLIIGLVFGVMLLKTLVLTICGKIFRLSKDQDLLFALALCQVGEFAFVLLSYSRQNAILPNDTVSILTAVVALSMALTPLVFLFYEKGIQPIFLKNIQQEEREFDEIDTKHPVIIAGFGRFGNITGRFLLANGIQCTILDNDSDRVEVLRKMGYKVYYGDATRNDMLASAGAENAKLIIIAMDTPEQTQEVVKLVKKHYPNMQMLVRSEDLTDTFELMDLGVVRIYREYLDTSLRMGVDAMKLLGFRAYASYRSSQTFLRHDEQAIKGFSASRDDRKQFISTARDRMEELTKQLQIDKVARWRDGDSSWEAETMREEARIDPEEKNIQ
ncbi:CPA2 family monovalent cation:H+ antiporter-2/glutathione-regulated potassium-efflux system protein KefB [Chitinophaga skermanii]|uniref:CPA2 family monovalent cation:H+ antiporter-2/glutathione-regulated potassium-efflux system protein KefB n=1 Tax=Chitinophaga skermanii TaxID=331697 RepID=A0A327QSR1_9BACT|nr:monovalent cation:proton antiporter-2 (CPA2) family protein [Chitinophaga skermanii]RAJ06732.1 CPA2 family monovalent cation:H+ antiporter-2/glutathione-regulated potassium-efflux system protein KefB [Chitinophaga skermanii]